MEGFRIKEYGRTELALLYSPSLTPDAAWRRLKRWIFLFPGLTERLEAIGYCHSQRSFTPAQVRMIVEALGEP